MYCFLIFGKELKEVNLTDCVKKGLTLVCFKVYFEFSTKILKNVDVKENFIISAAVD